MAAQHFTSSDFEEKVMKAEQPVVVDFYATWCGPCQMAAPIIDKLSEELNGKVILGKVNVDENQDLAQNYGVMSIPTIIIFKNGKEVERKIGFPGESGLRAMIEAVAK